jgi:hypothetical protein
VTIHWTFLLLAVVLTWLPYPLPKSINDRLQADPPVRPRPPSVGGVLRVWTNWVAFLAATVAAYLLENQVFTIEPNARGVGIKILAIKAAVFLPAILIHMLRMKKELNMFAPAALLSGITLGLCGPLTGPFAVVVGWLFAAVQKNPMIQLPVTAIVGGGAGFLIHDPSIITLALAVGLLLLPHFIALMAGQVLLIVSVESKKFVE